MAEIKRVNIYMGVVGQAYVDKETALSNLNAAIKNVHDMEEIIQAAEQQQPIANNALNSAIEAKELAQLTYDRLIGKYEDSDTTDPLYNSLLNIVKDLNINDNDNNPYNGGSNKTAQENVDEINKQIAELSKIIEEGNESLQRRIAFVNELQVVYDNALETFKSYLPEEEGYDWDAWDKEEELLWARINAVIEKLAQANEITEAINDTSKDVVSRAIEVILAICNKNGNKISEIESNEIDNLTQLDILTNDLLDVRRNLEQYNYTYDAISVIENINSDLERIENYITELRDYKIPQIQNNRTNNDQIKQTWNNIKESLQNETFNIDMFNISVNDIYIINREINEHNNFLIDVRNNIITFNSSLENYRRQLQNIIDHENNANYPETIQVGDITYYRDDPGDPGEGWYQLTEEYNGRTYYAWVINQQWMDAPETIERNGITYSKRWSNQPGENYDLLTEDVDGIIYYAWVSNQQNGYWFSIGAEEINENNYTTANNATQVTEYQSEFNYTNESRSYLYILLSSDKTIQLIDPAINGIIDVTEVTSTNIEGYTVWMSGVKLAGTIKVKIS